MTFRRHSVAKTSILARDTPENFTWTAGTRTWMARDTGAEEAAHPHHGFRRIAVALRARALAIQSPFEAREKGSQTFLALTGDATRRLLPVRLGRHGHRVRELKWRTHASRWGTAPQWW